MNKFCHSNYEFLEKIGEGGICEILKIRHRQSNDIFAFKKLKSSSADSLRAITREYRFLKFHNHPGIVKAFEYVNYHDCPGIVMEFVDGPTLESRKNKINIEQIYSIMLEIIEIANFVNHCGFIYNDYKLQNFILAGGHDLKLIDFNLIRRLDEKSSLKSGTLAYLAPEVLAGNPASMKSDIYSLGVMLYELITGRMPFEASDEGALIKLITETMPASLNSGSSNVDETIMRMLEKSSDDRFKGFFEIAESLGMEDEFRQIVKNHSQYYIDAGIWPGADQVLDEISAAHENPLIVLSANKYINERLFQDTSSLARLTGSEVHVYSTEDKAEIALNEQASEPISNVSKRHRLDNHDSGGPIHLINCSNVWSNDILSVTESALANLAGGSGAAIFTSDNNVKRIGNVSFISVNDSADKDKIYLDHFLKRYSVTDGFILKISEFADVDARVMQAYLNDLIKNEYLVYDSEGWEQAKEIDDISLPSPVVAACEKALDNLPKLSREILNWLAVLEERQDISSLAGLTKIESSDIGSHLKILMDYELVNVKEELFGIWGRGRRETIYNRITDETRSSYHERAYEYFKAMGQDGADQSAHHCFHAGLFERAIDLNYNSASAYFDKFDFKKADKFIRTAEAASGKIGNETTRRKPVIKVFILAGNIAKALAENSRAEEKYLMAMEMAKNSGYDELLAEVYKNLGDLYRLRQKPAESIDCSRKALEFYKAQNDLPHQAACLNNLGLAYWTAGDYNLALRYFRNSLEVNIKLEDLTEQSKIYNNIAIINDIQGHKDDALGGFKKALDCAIATGNLQLEAKYLGNIGYFHLSAGRPRDSLEYFRQSYNLAMKIGYDEGQLDMVSNIAQAYHKLGNFIESAKANQKALEIAGSLKHERFRVQAAYLLARDCLVLGNYKLSGDMLRLAESICETLSNPEIMNDITLLKIEYFLAVGDKDKCNYLLNALRENKVLTNDQITRRNYLRLKALNLFEDRGEDSSDSALSGAIESNINELSDALLLEGARAMLNAKNLEAAKKMIETYGSRKVSDTLMDYDYRLISARYFAEVNAYDDALELLDEIEKEATDSGCLPVVFNALIGRAVILEKCGKKARLETDLGQLDQIFKQLLDSLPADTDHFMFQAVPPINEYLKLADRYDGGAGKRGRVVPKKENRLGG